MISNERNYDRSSTMKMTMLEIGTDKQGNLIHFPEWSDLT
jgi:hypothetical protein